MTLEERKEQVDANLEMTQIVADEIYKINSYLQADPDEELPPARMMRKLNWLTAMKSRVGQLRSESEAVLSFARAYWSEELDQKISATRFREILEGKVILESKMKSQCERTSATIDVTAECVRSQLSFAKEELSQSRRGGHAT